MRAQIEELDALRAANGLLTLADGNNLDDSALSSLVIITRDRVLPRLKAKPSQSLREPPLRHNHPLPRPPSLTAIYDSLSEYVHPNYGSHALTLQPESAVAAQLMLESFIAIYEDFFSLSWADQPASGVNAGSVAAQTTSDNPFNNLVNHTIPAVRSAVPTIPKEAWSDAVQCLRDYPMHWNDVVDEDSQATAAYSGAIASLIRHEAPQDQWPSSLRTTSGKQKYMNLLSQEQQLSREARSLMEHPDANDDRSRLAVILAGITFAINITEHKITLLATQSASLLLKGNVPGAAISIRSIMEHHAIAYELGQHMSALWDKTTKVADKDDKMTAAIKAGERQLARALAGGSGGGSFPSSWKTLWDEVASKHYNMEPRGRRFESRSWQGLRYCCRGSCPIHHFSTGSRNRC